MSQLRLPFDSNGNEGAPVALVACVAGKRDAPAPAAELYTSDWFQKARRWVERHARAWHILSARHGLLDPDEVIEPYEERLNPSDGRALYHWGWRVACQLLSRYPDPTTFVILAGRTYRRHLLPMLRVKGDHETIVPMEGLGIGEQKRWLMGRPVEGAMTPLTRR